MPSYLEASQIRQPIMLDMVYWSMYRRLAMNSTSVRDSHGELLICSLSSLTCTSFVASGYAAVYKLLCKSSHFLTSVTKCSMLIKSTKFAREEMEKFYQTAKKARCSASRLSMSTTFCGSSSTLLHIIKLWACSLETLPYIKCTGSPQTCLHSSR